MRKKLSISLLLFGIALTSCVREELDKPCPLVLNLNSTWSPNAEVIPMRSTSGLLPIPQGTTLGVRVQDLSQTAASNYISYTAAADGSVAPSSSNALTVNPKHNYDLYLYSPFRNDATTQGTFVHGEDVMWVEALRNFKGGVTINRTLIHKMSQAVLAVEYASDVPQNLKDNYPIENATIEVSGFFDNCTMDLATGVINPGTDRNSKMTEQGKAVCFIPFSDNTATLTLKLILNGNDGTQKIFEQAYNPQIAAGISMLFTLTLDEEGIKALNIKIDQEVQPWVVGDGVNISMH